MKLPTTDCDWAILHQRTLYRFDERERICGARDLSRGGTPEFHFVRTLHGNLWRFHCDLSDSTCRALARLAARELPLREGTHEGAPPERLNAMRLCLETPESQTRLWRGPLYHFASVQTVRLCRAASTQTVFPIEPTDRGAVAELASVFPALAADIVERQPLFAAKVQGRVASVCCSATAGVEQAIEASVQTGPGDRGSGLAGDCVAHWGGGGGGEWKDSAVQHELEESSFLFGGEKAGAPTLWREPTSQLTNPDWSMSSHMRFRAAGLACSGVPLQASPEPHRGGCRVFALP